MRRHSIMAIIVMASSPLALALPTSINLSLTAATPTTTLAATGFDNAYNLTTTGTANVNGVAHPPFSVGPTGLSIATLPGDTYGQYDTTIPNTAPNMFYSGLDADGAGGTTTVMADVNVQNLNNNFHGGGIWIGMDQNHYVRLGIINNTFNGGIAAEAIRENMDLWTSAPIDPGPGGDIVDQQIGSLGASPQTAPFTAVLKIVRTGTTAQAFVSTDNGATFQQLGGAGYSFDSVDTLASQMNNPSTDANDTPPELKVGVYAFGGGSTGLGDALVTFSNFSATSVPEPAALGMLIGLLPLIGRRRKV